MTTEGTTATKTRASDEYSRPRSKICHTCADLPDRRAIPTCPECGRPSTATRQISGGPSPKSEGRAARAGSLDQRSHASKDPAADSAHSSRPGSGDAASGNGAEGNPPLSNSPQPAPGLARSRLPSSATKPPPNPTPKTAASSVASARERFPTRRRGDRSDNAVRALFDPSPHVPGVGSGDVGSTPQPSAAEPCGTAHALPDPVWYIPPPPETVVVVETTAHPPRRLPVPPTAPRKLILPARYIEAAETVAARYGFTLDDLRAQNRNASLAYARREAMIAVRALGASYPETGAVFNRDHTSAMSAIKRKRPLAKVRVLVDGETKSA